MNSPALRCDGQLPYALMILGAFGFDLRLGVNEKQHNTNRRNRRSSKYRFQCKSSLSGGNPARRHFQPVGRKTIICRAVPFAARRSDLPKGLCARVGDVPHQTATNHCRNGWRIERGNC
jgi:hypothetical protein